MKKGLIGIGLCLLGCSTPWVYSPTPTQPIVMEQAAVANGVLAPQGFYFTLISQYQGTSARVVVLTDPALKLADMTVSASQIYVHEKAPRISQSLVTAWGELVQQSFLTSCPARQIRQEAKRVKGPFELAVTGGVCP